MDVIKTDDQQEHNNKEYEELILSLPRSRNWAGTFLYQYQGVWCEPKFFQPLLSFRNHFEARDSDIVISTLPKSGTTWLKALTFSITTRTLHSPLMTNSPLLSSNPHNLVHFFEFDHYRTNPSPVLDHLPNPRIFSTHVPCKLLPTSINDTKCRIIYLCRNPLDMFISYFLFFQKVTLFRETDTEPKIELQEAFDMFCQGIQLMGPCWDHALGYWNMSLERPEKVLFLKFEGLKEDVVGCTKKVAEFLGCPFSEEEEARGVIRDVVKLCSFDTLKGLEVNKSGEYDFGIKNKYFFRKGEVGDWANHLTPDMVGRVEKIMEEKLRGSGLTFDFKFKKL